MGGVTFSVLSEPEARMLVCFFSLQMLTSMSSGRLFSPTTMPSYTSTPGGTIRAERSWMATMAFIVVGPRRSATIEPVPRLRILPAHFS